MKKKPRITKALLAKRLSAALARHADYEARLNSYRENASSWRAQCDNAEAKCERLLADFKALSDRPAEFDIRIERMKEGGFIASRYIKGMWHTVVATGNKTDLLAWIDQNCEPRK